MDWLRDASTMEYSIYSLVLGYYEKHILKQDGRNFNAYSEADKPQPDGIRGLTFGTGGEGKEWVMVWSKPEYDEKFIGVHASFSGNFNTVDLSEGRSDWRYYMPIPFYDLLDSFKTNSGNTTKKVYGLPSQKRAF